MTYKDIYTKFLIAYDKADVTSSYPSLTPYEIATLLDRAYLSLISLKFTGNNIRKAGFEQDIKVIEDLRPLIKVHNRNTTSQYSTETKHHSLNDIKNSVSISIPDDFLYYVSSNVTFLDKEDTTNTISFPTKLIDHLHAAQFLLSGVNIPWIKYPVVYMQEDKLVCLYDPYSISENYTVYPSITYLKKPESFVNTEDLFTDKEFELSDTFAEELINLAVTMAVENVESSRLSSRLQTMLLLQ